MRKVIIVVRKVESDVDEKAGKVHLHMYTEEVKQVIAALKMVEHTCGFSPTAVAFDTITSEAKAACPKCTLSRLLTTLESRLRKLEVPQSLQLLDVLSSDQWLADDLVQAGFTPLAVAYALKELREFNVIEIVARDRTTGVTLYRMPNDVDDRKVKKVLKKAQKMVREEEAIAETRARLGYAEEYF